MAGNRANLGKVEDVLFPTDEPVAAKAMRKVMSTFKTILSFSGATIDEVHGTEERVVTTEEPSGADLYFNDILGDPRFKGLSAEESIARATSLALEESMKSAAKSMCSVMSLGEVEMSEIYGSTSAGTSRASGSDDIDDGYNTPSSSTCARGDSDASGSSDIV